MKTAEEIEQGEAVRVRSIGTALAGELGILSGLILLVLLLLTTKLRPPPAIDATCVLPKVAAKTSHGYEEAMAACGVQWEDVDLVWKAHLDAERLEGFVLMPQGAP